MQTKDLIRLYMKPEHRKLIHEWLVSDRVLEWITTDTIEAHKQAQQLTVQVFDVLDTLFRQHNVHWHIGQTGVNTCIRDIVANGEIHIAQRKGMTIAIPDFIRAWNESETSDEVWENLKPYFDDGEIDEHRESTKSARVQLHHRAILLRQMGYTLKSLKPVMARRECAFGKWEV